LGISKSFYNLKVIIRKKKIFFIINFWNIKKKKVEFILYILIALSNALTLKSAWGLTSIRTCGLSSFNISMYSYLFKI